MKLTQFIKMAELAARDCDDLDAQVEFVGIKWQEEHHPSAELFPIEFVNAKSTGKYKVTLKFVTTKHNQ